jgi:hypothetical protein
LFGQHLEIIEPDEPQPRQTEWLQAWIKQAETALPRIKMPWSPQQTARHWDWETFRDHIILSEVFKNPDECLRILRWLPSADSNTLVDPSVLVAVRLVMDRLAVLSPADALDAANGLSPILRAEALPEIMRVWSATAPEEAAAWMTERRGPAFKSGADDARLTAELVRHWAVISASTASEWPTPGGRPPIRLTQRMPHQNFPLAHIAMP